jgi:hypothetical protein
MPQSATATIQIGTYNPQTDTFTSVLDLNDYTNTWQLNDSPEIGIGEKKAQKASNPRTDGERITNEVYSNRHINLKMHFGKAATYTTIRALVTTFLGVVEAPPFVLRYAPPSPNASVNYSYFDVLSVSHNLDNFSPKRIINGTLRVVAIFECAPYIRGDRVWCQNLVCNPGFEQPFGGGNVTTAQNAFTDTFATVNSYAVQAGGAPTLSPNKTWVDIVQALNPVRFLRLGEASGTTAYDISGLAQHGTLQGSGTTLGAAGLISGDGDTAYTFNGSGGVLAAGTTGLPLVNAAWSLMCAFTYAVAPGATQVLGAHGGTGVNNGAFLGIDTAGKLNGVIFGGPTIVSSAGVLGVGNHLAILTWDGTTLTLRQDNATVGTATPAALAITNAGFAVAQTTTGTSRFNNKVDEAALFATSILASASALFTAFNTGATGTVSSAMSLPAAGRIAFGSPAWGALNAWTMRFRFTNTATYTWYLHRTDANNYIAVTLTGTALTLKQVVASVSTTVQTTAPFITRDAWYWITMTQYPVSTSAPPYLQASLFYDRAGAVGSAVTSGVVAGRVGDGVTAVIGRPNIETATAAMIIGGGSNTHTVTLFGPGGWTPTLQVGAATAFSMLAWEGDRYTFGMATTTTVGVATTPNGPVMSRGALRIDLAPAGTVDVETRLYTGGAPAGTQAIAIRTAGDIIRVAAHSISSGLGANATRTLRIREYDSTGVLLRTDANWHGTAASAPTLTGNTASWPGYNFPNLADFYTTGVSCAYVDLALRVTDTNVGASANGIAWFDNVQVWNQTRTGMSTMDYHELRFPNSPAQIMVSGLQGEVAAPCAIHWNTFQSSVGAGAVQSFWIGLRAASASYFGSFITPCTAYTPALDSTAFSGFTQSAVMGSTTQDIGWSWTQSASYLTGVWRLLERLKTSQTGTATSGNLSLTSIQCSLAEYAASGLTSHINGRINSPAFAASATWGVTDAGLMTIPGAPVGAFADISAFTAYQIATVTDPNNTGVTITSNWAALVPADDTGTLVTGQITYPSSSSNLISQVFIDGLNAQLQRDDIAVSATLYTSTTYTTENRPEYGVSGPGVSGTTGQYGVTLGQDSVPYVVPNITLVNGVALTTDVNQGVAIVTDASGAVLPFLADIIYTPLYIYPRG